LVSAIRPRFAQQSPARRLDAVQVLL